MEVIIRCPQCGKRVFDAVGKTYGKINSSIPVLSSPSVV